MFSNAYQLASNFTKPVITSHRFTDNSTESSLASFIFLNPDGWIMTAGHVLNSLMLLKQHQKEINDHNIAIKAIESNKTLFDQQKKSKIQHLKKQFQTTKRLINHSFWWGGDNLRIDNFKINFEIDLAIGKIENFDSKLIKNYPKIIDPQKILVGTSLCKLGYPFYQIKTTFDATKNGFIIDPKVFPIPRFPLEGMYTRNIVNGPTTDKKYVKKFIETSTPGLKGQSGGPLFDVHGNIWGLQSQTISIPLGFSPKLKKGNKETIEHQFINVGLGVHPEIIVQFLNEHKITFETVS